MEKIILSKNEIPKGGRALPKSSGFHPHLESQNPGWGLSHSSGMYSVGEGKDSGPQDQPQSLLLPFMRNEARGRHAYSQHEFH